MTDRHMSDSDELPLRQTVDKKYSGKPPMYFLSALFEPLQEVARVLDFGNSTYEDIHNFKTIEAGRSRFLHAALRHILASEYDRFDNGPKGSGLRHLAHAACCVLMALWFEFREGPRRPKPAPKVWEEAKEGTVKPKQSAPRPAQAVTTTEVEICSRCHKEIEPGARHIPTGATDPPCPDYPCWVFPGPV